MRLLWLSHLVPYPPKGGALQRSHGLLREVARYHEVHLLAFVQRALLERRFPSVEAGLAEAQSVLSGFCAYVEFLPIPCERYLAGEKLLALASLLTPTPYTINWLYSPRYRDAVRRLKRRGDFDAVHVDTISLAPYRRTLPDAVAVLDHHNIESHMMFRRAEHDRNVARKLYFLLEGFKLSRYERRTCPSFEAHVTCSELDSTRLTNVVPHLYVREIPNGVDTDYFTPCQGREIPLRLIFAGGMNWYPNASAMLFFAREVWPLLKRGVPGISMDVVGNDPPQYLQALARSDSSFRVHGFVDDVRPYLDEASVYVCPIFDGGGTKLKLLDAFAMAKATVAHRVACEGIAVTPGEHVLLADNPDGYVKQVGLLCNSPERRRQIGRSAQSLIFERYTYRAIGKDLSQLYADLASPPSARSGPSL